MMLTECRMRVSMTFLHQTMTMGGQRQLVGLTSTKLRNNIRRTFDAVETHEGAEVRTFNLLDANYGVSYSAPRQPNPFLVEKDMTVTANLVVRHRPIHVPVSGSRYAPSNTSRTAYLNYPMVKEVIRKLQAVVNEGGGTFFGDAELWAYLPISFGDRGRLGDLFQNNTWDFLPNYFNGEDVPSTAFACIGNYTFTKTQVPYLVSDQSQMGAGLRTTVIGQLNSPFEQDAHTRMILGIGGPYDTDYYNAREGRSNCGRIIDGPMTAELIEAVRSQSVRDMEEGSGHNMWRGDLASDSDDYYEDYDNTMEEEDDYF